MASFLEPVSVFGGLAGGTVSPQRAAHYSGELAAVNSNMKYF